MTTAAPPRRRRARQEPQQAAWRFHRKTGQPYDELEAIAFVGLIRGCRRYDPERLNPANGQPYALSTIVCPFITGEILHWFRDKGHAIKFPNKWRERWGKVQRLMGDPSLTTQDVAEQSGLSVDELGDMHLLNIEAFLRRKHKDLLDTSPPPGSIGEIADWLANQDWLALQNSDIFDIYPVYEDILTEIRKRKLLHVMELFHEKND